MVDRDFSAMTLNQLQVESLRTFKAINMMNIGRNNNQGNQGKSKANEGK